MMLIHETAISRLDAVVARLRAHAEDLVRRVEALRARRVRAAGCEGAHDRLELLELCAANAERARNTRQRFTLLGADDARAERGLQLDLHERPRQAAATFELGEPVLQRVARALTAREVLD